MTTHTSHMPSTESGAEANRPETSVELVHRKVAPLLAFLGLVSEPDPRFWIGDSVAQ